MALSISVVIPVRNAGRYLRTCLDHIRDSTVQPLECIVVDDGSVDDSAAIARNHGEKVLRSGEGRGPAHARNLGAREARGDVLLFLDADVCVHQDTIERIVEHFSNDPELDAVIGSYDDAPGDQDFLSQYKNLMHSFVHQTGHTSACTFWSGCGAIRRQVFLDHSGFDETYGRPAIEDIELGYRLSRAGRKLLLDKGLLVKHLKHWSFWGLVKTDILDRGIPWTELILRDRHMPNDLNLQLSQRVSVALSFCLLALTLTAAIWWRGYFVTPLLALLFLLMMRYWVESSAQAGQWGATVAMAAVVGAIAWLAYRHDMIELVPPLLLGYVLLFLRHRYSFVGERRRRFTGLLFGVYGLFTVLFISMYLPNHMLVLSILLVLLVVVILNNQFYLFLAAKRGRLFALAAVPFHLLYHLYNGISFLAGTLHYAWKKLRRDRPHDLEARASDVQR